MNEFLREIESQPQALLDTFNFIKENQAEFLRLKDIMKSENISRVIFTGMGSSYYSSYIPYYLLNKNGINADMREAGEFLMYSFPDTEEGYFNKTIIVLISQSGESGEVVQILEKLGTLKKPPFTIGITNTPKSTLATHSNMVLLTKAGEEKSVTTKSYVCTLLLLYIFAKFITVGELCEEDTIEIEQIIKEVERYSKESTFKRLFLNAIWDFFYRLSIEEVDYFKLISRGPSLATAYQGALNFKEIVKKHSEASPCSTFNHGEIESLDINSHLVIISSENNNFKQNVYLITKMFKEMEYGNIIHITNKKAKGEPFGEDSRVLQINHEIHNPFLSPIIEIVILQVIYYKMAERRGLIPGEFRFTQKITRDI